MIKDRIEHYDTNKEDEVTRETMLYNDELFKSLNCDCRKDDGSNIVAFQRSSQRVTLGNLLPFRNFVRFTGPGKLWESLNHKSLT